MKTDDFPCYCGSQKKYQDCCHRFLSCNGKPETPEQLMRSRYSAFCRSDIEYLISTRHPSRRQPDDRDAVLGTLKKTQWLGLKVLETRQDPIEDTIGYVEFAAFYKTDEMGQLHEISKFIREKNQWYYVDGVVLGPLVFGRNEPCWCGSKKKIKKCHGRS